MCIRDSRRGVACGFRSEDGPRGAGTRGLLLNTRRLRSFGQHARLAKRVFLAIGSLCRFLLCNIAHISQCGPFARTKRAIGRRSRRALGGQHLLGWVTDSDISRQGSCLCSGQTCSPDVLGILVRHGSSGYPGLRYQVSQAAPRDTVVRPAKPPDMIPRHLLEA